MHDTYVYGNSRLTPFRQSPISFMITGSTLAPEAIDKAFNSTKHSDIAQDEFTDYNVNEILAGNVVVALCVLCHVANHCLYYLQNSKPSHLARSLQSFHQHYQRSNSMSRFYFSIRHYLTQMGKLSLWRALRARWPMSI